MNFSFNPSFLFICRFCRHMFPNTDKLKEHKLKNHLGDCMGIKCIIFEERYNDGEWIPPTAELASKKTKTSNCFMNPYVSLTRLTHKELDSALNSTNQGILHKGNEADNATDLSFDQDELAENTEIKIEEATTGEQNVITSENIDYSVKEFTSDFEPLAMKSNVSQSELGPTIDLNQSLTTNFNQVNKLNSSFANPVINNSSTICQAQKLTSHSEQEEETEINYIQLPELFFDSSCSSTQPKEENVHELHDPLEEQLESQEIHHQEVSSSKFKRFMCPTCGVCFSKRPELNQHMKSHSNNRPFKCPHCPSSFKRKSHARVHLISFHGEITPHKCRICGKFFQSNNVLVVHERTHSGDRPFKCNISNCKSTYTSESLLKMHFKIAHFEELGLPQLICHICGKSFGVKGERNRHLRNSHKLTNAFGLIE